MRNAQREEVICQHTGIKDVTCQATMVKNLEVKDKKYKTQQNIHILDLHPPRIFFLLIYY